MNNQRTDYSTIWEGNQEGTVLHQGWGISGLWARKNIWSGPFKAIIGGTRNSINLAAFLIAT